MPWQKGKQLFKGNQLHVWLEEADVNRIVNSGSLSQLLETAISDSECLNFGDILTAYGWGPNVMEYLSDMTDATLVYELDVSMSSKFLYKNTWCKILLMSHSKHYMNESLHAYMHGSLHAYNSNSLVEDW